MSLSANVTEIARRHASLPVKRNYRALKQVLRDWYAYTYHTSLQDKLTYRAELHVHVHRNTMKKKLAESTSINSSGDDNMTTTRSAKAVSAQPSLFDRWYGITSGSVQGNRTRHDDDDAAARVTANNTHDEKESTPVYTYTKAVALDVWTAVLPWETQMGLSGSTLAAVHPGNKMQDERSTRSTMRCSKGVQSHSEVEAEAAKLSGEGVGEAGDPYGVVSAPSVQAGASSCPACWPTSPTPAMLFLMSTHDVSAHRGLHFWSGGITSPLDVLFAQTVLPSSISSSASFAQLRRSDASQRVRDNLADADVGAAYFPVNDLHSTVVSLRVQSYGHLDPYPNVTKSTANTTAARTSDDTLQSNSALCHHISGLQDVASFGDGTSRNVSSSPTPSAGYVVETVRYLVRDAVQHAVSESSYAFARRVLTQDAHVAVDTEEQASIELTLELSDELKEDLEQKARLAVHYVPLLEAAIDHHLHERRHGSHAHLGDSDSNHASGISNGSDKSNESDDADDDDDYLQYSRHARRNDDSRRESENEKIHSACDELAKAETVMAERTDTSEGCTPRSDGSADKDTANSGDGNEESMKSMDRSYSHHGNFAVANIPDHPVSQLPSLLGKPSDTAADNASVLPSFIQPAQPHAVRAERSISLQSPMLASETEGRPHYLVPSFTQRHESTTLHKHLCLSADKLARYSRARPEMPAEQPVDYELFDLCLRLGVGRDVVVMHYYQRILRDWTRELVALRRSRVGASCEDVGVAHTTTDGSWKDSNDDTPINEISTTTNHSNNDSYTQSNCSSSSLSDGESGSAKGMCQLASHDVQRMLRLVQDTSLQIPEELRALVEAMAHSRGIV